MNLILWRANMSRSARFFISWFGPRGLNSLLLALIVVQKGVPAAEWLLAITGVVVIVSVVVHGISAMPLSAWYGNVVARETLPEERESSAEGLLLETADDVPRVTPQELSDRLSSAHPPLVLDVRTRSAYQAEAVQIPGSVRVLPDRILEWAAEQPRGEPIAVYCT